MLNSTQLMDGVETSRLTAIRLEVIDIAHPCPADWSAMDSVDGDRVRHCRHCAKNVFNLSAMARDEAETLVGHHINTAGSICVRMFKRADGTVTTADCKGRWKDSAIAWAKRWGGPVGAALSIVLAMMGCEDKSSGPVVGTSPVPMGTTGIVAAPRSRPASSMSTQYLGGACAPPTQQAAILQGSVPTPATQPQTLHDDAVMQPAAQPK